MDERAFTELGVRAAFTNSAAGLAAGAAKIEQAFVNGELDLLCIAPERLATAPAACNCLEQGRIALFAIDEAHCVSAVGP